MADQDKTWGDLVREYFPDADNALCDYILWNLTAFPCCSLETVKSQLVHVKEIGIEAAYEEGEKELLKYMPMVVSIDEIYKPNLLHGACS